MGPHKESAVFKELKTWQASSGIQVRRLLHLTTKWLIL